MIVVLLLAQKAFPAVPVCTLHDVPNLAFTSEVSYLRNLSVGLPGVVVNGRTALEFSIGPPCQVRSSWPDSYLRVTSDGTLAGVNYQGLGESAPSVDLEWRTAVEPFSLVETYDISTRLENPTSDVVLVLGTAAVPMLFFDPISVGESSFLEKGVFDGGSYLPGAQLVTGNSLPGTSGNETVDTDGSVARFGSFGADGWALRSTDWWEYASDYGPSAVAIWGDHAAVGWAESDNGAHRGGTVTTYRRDCDGTWSRAWVLPDPYENEYWKVQWGQTLAMWGDLLAVAATGDSDIGLIGWVTVYRLSPDGLWGKVDEMLDPSGSPTEPYGQAGFGRELALYGNHLAVLDATSTRVYVYELPTVDQDDDGYDDATDCEDLDPAVHPGGEEVCNGLDDDCDGEVDPGCPALDPVCPASAAPGPANGCCGGEPGRDGLWLAPLLLLRWWRRR